MPHLRHIRRITFEGTPRERGIQRGRRLAETFRVPHLPAEPDFVRGCYEAVAKGYPAAIEEFEGIIEGGDFDRDRLLPYYFARVESSLGGPAPGCTMFAVEPGLCQNPEKGPLVGRNYDWAITDLRWCELHRILPATEPRRLGYTHHWAGNADVLTERGLYVAIASLPPEEVHAPGVQWSIVVEMLAATCSTVQEAADTCAGVRHLRPMSYLLADAAGSVGIVEATPEEVRLRRPETGIVSAANIAQGGEILRRWEERRVPGSLTEPVRPRPPNYRGDALQRAQRRVERAEALLRRAAPSIAFSDVRRALQDHEAPTCTGDHADPDGAPWGTIWSGICRPATGEFNIAPGLPCRNPYQEFEVGDR